MSIELEWVSPHFDKNGLVQHYTYTLDVQDMKHVIGWLHVTSAEREGQLQQPMQLSRHPDYWLYRDQFVRASTKDASEEVVLRIKYEKLAAGKDLDKLRREVEVLERVREMGQISRQPIPQHVQMFVWQRDGGRCVKCESQEKLEFDHIIPLAEGGSNTERNLQLLCEPCNRRKGSLIGF